ncbi:MAG: HAD family hydrolase [Candidatus Heimdallarchaeaceae archaeon]
MDFKALLFDLDGTLIDFDPQEFIKTYLGAASQFFSDLIPDSEVFFKELLNSTDAMETADNKNTTALEDFLIDFCPKFKVGCDIIAQRFFQFYTTKFEVIKPLIKEVPGARELLISIKKQHPEIKIILATNPVFPYVAIKRRMEWGGIPEEIFDLITHAENSNFCKGNKQYWLDICSISQCTPEQSLVIGNDGLRDMSAKKYGFSTFLVTERAENEKSIPPNEKPDFVGNIDSLRKLLLK